MSVLLLLLSLLLLSFVISALSLQLRRSWQAISGGKSVLAISGMTVLPPVPKSPSLPRTGTINNPAEMADNPYFLATAGHDGGMVRFWKTSLAEGNSIINVTVAAVSTIHNGSIFNMASHSHRDYMLTGSFDRSATVQRIQRIAKSSGDGETLAFTTVATLPEHTGWVRKVHIVSLPRDDEQGGGVYLSIGCNFINVWTSNDSRGGDQTINLATLPTAVARRLARLDAGPSPGDPEEEMAFRRHDILTMDVAVASPGENPSSVIVAGLVDGTLRAFWWNFLNKQRERAGGDVYDGTGSCGNGIAGDERPYAAVCAHQGRVTGIHAVGNTPEKAYRDFITVGHDGYWRRWRLDSMVTSSFTMIEEGSIVGLDGGDCNAMNYRICASVLVPQNESEPSLVVGTTSGSIYHISLARREGTAPAKGRKMWKEATAGCAITSLACMPGMLAGTCAVVAGSSNGFVHIFG